MNSNLYNELLNRINDEEIPDEDVIIKDMHRTFPANIIFTNQLGPGQRTLYRICSCLSLKNKKIGYAQGMSFIIAMFLFYEDEETSFWMMENLLKNYSLKDMFCSGFPGLKKNFFVMLKLMKRLLPNIFKQFLKFDIPPPLYASSWYLTSFTNNIFPHEITRRVFDCYLMEGSKIIHRFSLGVLALKEREILSTKNNSEVFAVLSKLNQNINFDSLFAKSFSFSISRKEIEKYECLYTAHLKGKIPGDEDIMNQIKI